MRPVTNLVVLLMVVPLIPLGAQKPIEAGERVRVTAPTLGFDRQIATFIGFEGDTLVLARDSGQAGMRCPLTALGSIDVSRGQKSKTPLGAGVGFLVGSAIGLAVGAAAGGYDDVPGAAVAGMGAVAGGLLGLVIGAGTGSQVKSDRWEVVPLAELHAATRIVGLRSHSVGVSLRF